MTVITMWAHKALKSLVHLQQARAIAFDYRMHMCIAKSSNMGGS